MQSKRERRQMEQRRQEQAQRTRRILIGAGIAIAVVVVIVIVLQSGALNPTPTPVTQVASGSCGTVQSFPSLGQEHIPYGQPHVAYNSNPPSSGPHLDTPQNWGIYTVPQIQEQLVHNLEHGGIVIQYNNNNLSGPEVQQLTTLVNRDRYHMILAPYTGLPTEAKIALTAWTGPGGNPALQSGKLLYCTGVDENAIRSFINAYRDHGPELVP